MTFILHIINFLSSLLPTLTTKIIDDYNDMLTEFQARYQALKRAQIANTYNTTKDVAEAIAGEQSMECKKMKDFISKSISKETPKVVKKVLANNKPTSSSKNSKGVKKVSFLEPEKTNKSTRINNNTNKKRSKKKRKRTNTKAQETSTNTTNKETINTNKNQQQPTKQKRKTYKNKVWTRPKHANQDASHNE